MAVRCQIDMSRLLSATRLSATQCKAALLGSANTLSTEKQQALFGWQSPLCVDREF